MEDELDTAIEAFKNGKCQPSQLADILYRSVMTEDQVLDLLHSIGTDSGYTKQLNQVGGLYMALVYSTEKVA